MQALVHKQQQDKAMPLAFSVFVRVFLHLASLGAVGFLLEVITGTHLLSLLVAGRTITERWVTATELPQTVTLLVCRLY